MPAATLHKGYNGIFSAGTVYNAQYATCYCTSPDDQGMAACFDFNGATSDVTCNPTNNCSLSMAQPGEHGIQQGGPVYLVRTESKKDCISAHAF